MAGRRLSSYLLGAVRYKVTSPVVVALKLSGGEQYVYANGLMPTDTRPSQIEQLLDVGAIKAFEEVR